MLIEFAEKLVIPEEFGTDEYGDPMGETDKLFNEINTKIDFTLGASKFVLMDKEEDIVVKIPFNGSFVYDETDYGDACYFCPFDDYCEREAYFYEEAEEAGLSEFFAKTEYYGRTKNGVPFYVSEKVADTDYYRYHYDNDGDSKYKDRLDMLKLVNELYKKYYYETTRLWLLDAISWYGLDKTENLLKFLQDNNINDLHGGNVGRRANGAPVIFDYSGFYE